MRDELVVTAQPTGSGRPLWSIHPIGGSVLWLRRLVAAMPADRPIYGIQARGLDGQTEPFECIDDMAAHYVDEVRARQPEGPYLLSGASFGGVVAMEMARRLELDGDDVALVAMFDTFGPGYPTREHWVKRLSGVLARLVWSTSWRERGQLLAHLWLKLRGHERSVALTKGLDDLGSSSMVLAVRKVIAAHNRAIRQHEFRGYGGTTVLFRATSRPEIPGVTGLDEPTNGWGSVCEQLKVIDVDGDHRNMLDRPMVDLLGARLADELRRVDYSMTLSMNSPEAALTPSSSAAPARSNVE